MGCKEHKLLVATALFLLAQSRFETGFCHLKTHAVAANCNKIANTRDSRVRYRSNLNQQWYGSSSLPYSTKYIAIDGAYTTKSTLGSTLDKHALVNFDLVTNFYIIVPFNANTTLHTLSNFLCIVFKST